MHDPFDQQRDAPHPVIVLHGWFGHAQAWQPVKHLLDDKEFDYTFIDYRGYGARRSVAGVYTIDEIADDVLALADQLGFTRFSLIGHSMGGIASERVAMRAPQRIRTLVLIAPVPCCGMRFDDTTRAWLAAAAQHIDTRRAIIDHSTGGRLPARWVSAKAADSLAHSTPQAFAAYLQAWSQSDFSHELIDSASAHDYPVKLLVGRHDPRYHAALMRDTCLRWYPHAELDILDNAGHYPMDETPLILVARIEEFLRRHTSSRRHSTV